MKKKLLLGAISFTSAVTIQGILVWNGLPIKMEENQQYQAWLAQQNQISNLLYLDIAKIKYEISSEDNSLSDHLNNLENIKKKLEQIPSFINGKNRDAFLNLIQANAQTVNVESKLIEQFSNQNAILKNSLSYLPVLSNELHQQNYNLKLDNHLEIGFEELLQNLLIYHSKPDRNSVAIINTKLQQIQQLKQNKVIDADDLLTQQLINHTQLILKSKQNIDEINKKLDKLSISSSSEDLEKNYHAYYQEAITTKENYRLYAFLWSISIIGIVGYLVISNLSKTNRNIISILENFTEELESKVEARTAQLAATIEEAEKARNKAEEANLAKSRFLANMSHELRTPLNAILGFTQLMNRDRKLDREHQESIEIISRSGEHLLKLINDILEMSKIEAGQQTLNKNNFDLYNLLHNLEQMLRLKAQSKNLQLLFEIGADVPQYIVSDDGKLRQILLNLLGNGLKFTEEGGVALRVALDRFSKQTILRFEIEDTGSGIAPEEINKLFIPFEQTEAGRKSQEGTGLGLPISQKFLQLMGGEISVRSTLGQGSVFSFYVPIDIVNYASSSLKNNQRVIALASDREEYRILAVDDRPESRLLLSKLLSSLGFSVKEAANGKEAVKIWDNWSPQLILMDMRMPVMNGYEATKKIKAQAKGQSTKIIALTASVFEEEKADILSAGCDDFMRKPFKEEILLEKISEHLGVRYLYEDDIQTYSPHDRVTHTFSADIDMDLAVMPLQWRSKLYQAAEQVDNKSIYQLLEEIPAEYAVLRKILTDLVDNFRCDTIIDLTEKANSTE